MTEVEVICDRLGWNASQDLTKEEKNRLELEFHILLKELNLENTIKKISISYGDECIINEGNKARIAWSDDNIKNKGFSFETLKEYIFSNGEINRGIIRHELMHLKDIYDLSFQYDHDKYKQLARLVIVVLMEIWNIYIDSRLIKDYGLPSSRSKDDRKKAFFDNIIKDEKLFEDLWNKRDLTFNSIIEETKGIFEILSNKT